MEDEWDASKPTGAWAERYRKMPSLQTARICFGNKRSTSDRRGTPKRSIA
jgi:hypothetical protein